MEISTRLITRLLNTKKREIVSFHSRVSLELKQLMWSVLPNQSQVISLQRAGIPTGLGHVLMSEGQSRSCYWRESFGWEEAPPARPTITAGSLQPWLPACHLPKHRASPPTPRRRRAQVVKVSSDPE